jgi:hypothetical protein
MAPIKLGKLSVEISVNTIDGFIHDLIDIPVKQGFWVVFTAKDEKGRFESFPLVDRHYKIRIFDSYPEALKEAAEKIMKGKNE